MQLVPILSTIILVGTLATFILAVFAYILYKIRERRGAEEREEQPMPQPHVLMTPQQTAPALAAPAPPVNVNMYAPQAEQPQLAAPQPRYPQVPVSSPAGASNFFYEYTDHGFIPVDPQQPVQHQPVRQQPAESAQATEQQRDDEGFAWL